ncbi:hypothetical protein M5689_006863 [Euphorbia peplus]|nr:hypothetical protein M5689_006863 [Euphorbia peplus]
MEIDSTDAQMRSPFAVSEQKVHGRTVFRTFSFGGYICCMLQNMNDTVRTSDKPSCASPLDPPSCII